MSTGKKAALGLRSTEWQYREYLLAGRRAAHVEPDGRFEPRAAPSLWIFPVSSENTRKDVVV